MKSNYKLGQTYCTKRNEDIYTSHEEEYYSVVIQENSSDKNLMILAINLRENRVERTTKFRDSPDNYFEEVEIRAMDLMYDEICIRDNKTGTIIYGDVIQFLGENKIIQFMPFGNDLISNVQYEIETVEGFRLRGFLYCSHRPKNYYINE